MALGVENGVERFRVRNALDERWLAEAARALSEAEKLVWRMTDQSDGREDELDRLRMRIALLRCDVGRAQTGRAAVNRNELYSEWMNLSVWAEASGAEAS